ncbi:hypothetical protein PBY51_014636 [Eleginops maclovinus]|nr:hypothetical protein PBY51_014636 [Eleginops maclovinus]
MKPAKLRHLETKHPDYVKKDRAFFERKGEDYRQQQQRMVNVTSVFAKASSYLVAQRIAKVRKPHTIAEELLLPAAMDLCDGGERCGCQIAKCISVK